MTLQQAKQILMNQPATDFIDTSEELDELQQIININDYVKLNKER